MNNNQFLIGKHVKEFILLLDNYLLNYPRKYFELRNRLVNDSYNLLELAYLANYSSDLERKGIQVKALMKVNLIDFYLESSFKNKIISSNQCVKLSNKLLVINKMLYKWIEK